MNWLINALTVIVVFYAVLAGGMWLFQRKLLYYPNEAPALPKNRNLRGVDLIRITTSDHETLNCWYRKPEDGFPTIVYFHGNAGNLYDRMDKYRSLYEEGFGLLAVSYRGYGGSTGNPTEQGFYNDARAAIGWITDQGVDIMQILLYGESLGTGVATQMATEFNVGGLVLEAPYTSVTNRAAEMYPFVPVPLLIKDKFETIKKIGRVKAPLLLFHGQMDETIPVAHGEAVFASANDPKEAHFFDGIGHTDFDIERLAHEVHNFAREHGLITKAGGA